MYPAVLTLLCVGEYARVSGHTLVQPRGRWKVKTRVTSVWIVIPYRNAHTLTLKLFIIHRRSLSDRLEYAPVM